MVGGRILKAYQGKIDEALLTDADRVSIQYMVEGGLIPGMSSQFKNGMAAKFKTARETGDVVGMTWRAPLAAIEKVQGIMFDHWIPSLKIASYLKDIQTAIKTNPDLVNDPKGRALEFRKIAKSVDNRYGEMSYNTLFWNRMVKDLAVANTLSLGWQVGFIREYGGGMMDLGKAVTGEGPLKTKIAKGELDRPAFVIAYTAQALALGALMTYAFTGQGPQSLLDYIYPRKGSKDEKGNEERVNTMFFTREIASIYEHMKTQGVVEGLGHLVESKASGTVGLIADWATNVNSFGQEISDPTAPAFKRLQQKLAYTFEEIQPISVAASRKGSSLKDTALAVSGFTPAPTSVYKTRTEADIQQMYSKYYANKETPYEKFEFSKDASKLRQMDKAGGGKAYDDFASAMEDKYGIKEVRKLEKTFAQSEPTDTAVKMFSRFTWQHQKQLLDKMSDDERERFLPHSNKDHLRGKYDAPGSSP
jgi:hypothetical protein